MTEPRFSEHVCCVCGRPADGVGFAPKNVKSFDRIAWTCTDPECIALARATYDLRQLDFGRIDGMAVMDGGDAGGAYLESIGKTDLATLSADEWRAFLMKVVGSYRAALKGRLKYEAPF